MFFVPLNQDNNINLDHGVSQTNYYIQIKTNTQNPSQEPPTSSTAPNQDLKNMIVFCPCNIKLNKIQYGIETPKLFGGGMFPPLQLSTYDCYVRSELQTYSIAGKLLIGHACTFDAILC